MQESTKKVWSALTHKYLRVSSKQMERTPWVAPSIKLFSVNKVELIWFFFTFVLIPFFFYLGSNVNVVVLKRIPGPKTRVLKIPKRARTINHLKKMAGRIQLQEYPRQPQSQGNLFTKCFINLIRVLKRYRINIDVKHHLCYFINKVKFRN